MKSKQLKLAGIVAALLIAGSAQAANSELNPETGNTSAPSDWRFIPGQSFGGVAGALDGVARLSFTAKSDGKGYACSGSLLAGGMYVLTAAHCADDFSKMTVDFGWANGKAAVSRTVAVTSAYVNPQWTGALDTGADIAILKLSSAVTTIKGYNLSTTNDVGKEFLMAGYGTTSVANSNTATNWNDGNWGHYAYNTIDMSSQTFNQKVDHVTGWGYDASTYAPGVTYMSDFDSGAAKYDTLGRVGAVAGENWNNLGLGSREGLIAGGDSGGGDFVFNGKEWLLTGVHSWGWQGSEVCPDFGLTGCDAGKKNTSSFGDLSGSTATYSHVAWINKVTAVPEPETYAMLLSGLAMVGLLSRRRKPVAA